MGANLFARLAKKGTVYAVLRGKLGALEERVDFVRLLDLDRPAEVIVSVLVYLGLCRLVKSDSKLVHQVSNPVKFSLLFVPVLLLYLELGVEIQWYTLDLLGHLTFLSRCDTGHRALVHVCQVIYLTLALLRILLDQSQLPHRPFRLLMVLAQIAAPVMPHKTAILFTLLHQISGPFRCEDLFNDAALRSFR